ncbi:NUDIX domain-containing protein [Dysgonomonas sp. 25]|nr:NUDIX domain-containing protein [Dysgonomonas sp. 25]
MRILKEVYDSRHNEFLPQFSVECVILAFNDNVLKVLLRRVDMGDNWILPWGLVHKEEDVDETAERVLKESTSIENSYVKQFYLFGQKDRTDKELADKILTTIQPKDAENHWLRSRFLSLAYYALVEYGKVRMEPEEGEELSWFNVDKLPSLFAKHDQVIKIALRTIRSNIGYVPLGRKMLPEKFTMPELRAIYECILGQELDRRNFQRKMISTGLIIPLNETLKKGAHKSPHLYCFDKEKYQELLDNDQELVRIIL